jgi:hyperosmotically inducible periplasmic protein
MRRKRVGIFGTVLAGFAFIAVGAGPIHAQSSAGQAADNSGRNQVDKSHDTLTPVDQSNKPEDLKISRELRQSIVKDHDLSTDAKNIKIITIDGRVTLRGPVSTEQEKTTIAARAADIAGPANVHDELEVKGQ